jgi:[ribosomal protein S5]-alanine N-acetyltransferase
MPIGFCGIKVMQLNENDVVNLFYRFDPAVWGNGLASEAASAVIGWAAQNSQVSPVSPGPEPGDRVSRA